MSDAAVEAKTGKDWAAWFDILDAAGAARLGHQAIVGVTSKQHGAPRWWRQMIAVEYERARGLRLPHEKADGFSVSISKTFAAELTDLYAAVTQAAIRQRWFPKGSFAVSTQTEDKYCRGSWNVDGRLEFGFYAKGKGKAQIAVQVNKLARAAEVERERAAWKAALVKLQSVLTQVRDFNTDDGVMPKALTKSRLK
jgi:hypothetical protein